jgi:hypothetical protein
MPFCGWVAPPKAFQRVVSMFDDLADDDDEENVAPRERPAVPKYMDLSDGTRVEVDSLR